MIEKDAKKQGFVLWLTGLSGSGKTTIAHAICRQFDELGLNYERLDGDVLRGVFPNTGFTKDARDEHIRRVGFMASRLEHHGIAVVASFISPYRQARRFVRELCGHFIEVYVKASLAECQRRDVKGLYEKAANGEIRNFTGVDDPYEEPEHPEVVVDTLHQTVDESVSQIMNYLKQYTGNV